MAEFGDRCHQSDRDVRLCPVRDACREESQLLKITWIIILEIRGLGAWGWGHGDRFLLAHGQETGGSMPSDKLEPVFCCAMDDGRLFECEADVWKRDRRPGEVCHPISWSLFFAVPWMMKDCLNARRACENGTGDRGKCPVKLSLRGQIPSTHAAHESAESDPSDS